MAYDLGEYDMAKGTFQEHGTYALALVAPLFDTATSGYRAQGNHHRRHQHQHLHAQIASFLFMPCTPLSSSCVTRGLVLNLYAICDEHASKCE